MLRNGIPTHSLVSTAIAKEPLFDIANANAIAKAVWTEPSCWTSFRVMLILNSNYSTGSIFFLVICIVKITEDSMLQILIFYTIQLGKVN